MKTFRLSVFLCFALIQLSGCSQKSTSTGAETLFERYQQSVVLIRNEFYLEVDAGDGIRGYICNAPEGTYPMRTIDEQEARLHPLISYGTGFFISKNGKIATNRHVAFPEIEADELLKFQDYFDAGNGKSKLQSEVYMDSISEISNYIEEHANVLLPQTLQMLENRKAIFRQQKAELDQIFERVSHHLDSAHISLKVLQVSVAYNNTFIGNQKGYYECSVLDKSRIAAIDLAIIQLKSKQTPDNVTRVFDFAEHNPNVIASRTGLNSNISKGQMAVGDKLYMIGFNYGETIAQTGKGIKVQLTSGTVSQQPDDYKVLYSIPSLSGSSGSPVMDRWGNLVAINYAATANAQNFNYGVLARHLQNMLVNQTSEKRIGHLPDQQVKVYSAPIILNTADGLKATIVSFFRFEDQHNFDAIFRCFSPNLSRYWDLKHPTRDEIREHYEHSWSLVLKSQNRIEKIVEIDPFKYDVYTQYRFVNLKNELKNLKTVIHFEFDSSGKIVATYGI